MKRFVLLMIGYIIFVPVALAKVTAVDERGFISEHVLVVKAAPDAALRALMQDVHRWWDASHSFGGSASSFRIDDRAGGCFCEEVEGGVSVEHMRVVNVQPGRSLTLIGGLGPMQAMALSGSMTFQFKDHPEGSELHYRYSVGGYLPEGMPGLADAVDRVQLAQLERLAAYISTGKSLN
ncbi:MAG: hypothetical protein AAF541_04600 [Pseudomonadota bacterium]